VRARTRALRWAGIGNCQEKNGLEVCVEIKDEKEGEEKNSKKNHNLFDGLLGDTVFVANLLDRHFDNPFDFFLDLHTQRRKQTYIKELSNTSKGLSK